MKKQERVVPRKNYYILALLIVMVVIVTFLIFNINDKYRNSKLDNSYLAGYLNEVTENEINNIMTETTTEFFVLVTDTGNEDIYNFEKDLKKIIKKYDLRDNFVLINYGEKDDNLDRLNKKFNSNIKKLPAIIYFKDGVFVKNIDSSDELLRADEFDKLLDEYELKD